MALQVATAAINALRDSHYVLNGVTALNERSVLMEGAATNVVLWSRDLTNAAWTKTNITPALDVIGADGVASSASRLTATAANGTCLQAITLASSARFQSARVKRITGTGGVDMTTDGGATWTALTLTTDYQVVSIPTQTLANPSVGFRVQTSGDVIGVDYVQNETGTFLTSSIPTTVSAVTRGADSYSVPFTTPPQAMTLYTKFVERGTISVSGGRVFQIGNAANASPRLIVNATPATGYIVQHFNGVSSVVSQSSVLPVVGDTMELRAVVQADGSVLIGVSKNGAAETVAATSAGLAFAAAWSDVLLWLNGNAGVASATGFAAFLVPYKVAAGVKTLAQMQAL